MGRRKGFPRGGGYRDDPSWIFFNNDKPSITIYRHSVSINGTMEDAAIALSNAILNYKKGNPNANYGTWGPLDFLFFEGRVVIALSDQTAIDKENWNLLKKSTEKICNDLKAFM